MSSCGRIRHLLILAAIGFSLVERARAEGEGDSEASAAEENWENRQKKDGDSDKSMRLKEIVAPAAEYNYASFSRPDPFVVPNLEITVEKQSPMGKTIKMTSSLQAFALTELNVKGVWQTGSGEIRAVVQTPKGEGVVVKKGDPISSGKILSIERDKVMVRVYRLRTDGVREYEDVAMPAGLSTKVQRGFIQLEPGQEPRFINPESGFKGAPVAPRVPATANLQGAIPNVLPSGGVPPPGQVPGSGSNPSNAGEAMSITPLVPVPLPSIGSPSPNP